MKCNKCNWEGLPIETYTIHSTVNNKIVLTHYCPDCYNRIVSEK